MAISRLGAEEDIFSSFLNEDATMTSLSCLRSWVCDIKGRFGLSFWNELNGKIGAILREGLKSCAFVIHP